MGSIFWLNDHKYSQYLIYRIRASKIHRFKSLYKFLPTQKYIVHRDSKTLKDVCVTILLILLLLLFCIKCLEVHTEQGAFKR